MQISIVGVNHERASVALRERLAIPADSLPPALTRLRAVVGEGFILSTCNRTEIVAMVGHGESGGQLLARFLADLRGVPVGAITPFLRARAHADAVRHLFAIAAGLDSLILGEDQILAQLKAAIDAAATVGTLGATLHRLGDAALAAGKRVRTATALGQGKLSVVSVALREAAEQLGDLRERGVLIVGAGDTAELTLKHLTKGRHTRPAPIIVVNRSHDRARALARRYAAAARPWEAREGALAAADLVVSCTAAPAPILDASAFARAMAGRPARPLLCYDLAVPRDIAPAADGVPGVTVRDVDALADAGAAARRQRGAAVADAEAIVAAETERFMAWWRGRAVVPAITALRDHAGAIRDAELARALARLPDLDPREEAVVRDLATALVNKLLHRPVTTLKAAPEGANIARVVRELFGLPHSDDLSARPSPPALPDGHPEASRPSTCDFGPSTAPRS